MLGILTFLYRRSQEIMMEKLTPRQRDWALIILGLVAIYWSVTLYILAASIALTLGVVGGFLYWTKGINIFESFRNFWTTGATRELYRNCENNVLTLAHARWLLTPGIMRGAADFTAIKNYSTMTVLHWVVRWDRFDLFNLFIERGAPITAVNGNNENVLHFAVMFERKEIFDVLMNSPELPTLLATNNHSANSSPLEVAAENGNVSMFRVLYKKLRQDFTPIQKFNLLKKAAIKGKDEILKCVEKECGERILSLYSDETENLFHICAHANQEHCLDYLFELAEIQGAGALNIKNNDGHTPYDIAILQEHTGCMIKFMRQKASSTLTPKPSFKLSSSLDDSQGGSPMSSPAQSPNSSPSSASTKKAVQLDENIRRADGIRVLKNPDARRQLKF